MTLGLRKSKSAAGDDAPPPDRFQRLALAVKALSGARTHEAIVDIVRHTARDMTGALGVAIVLRDGDQCHYIAEDSAVPLWSGQKFPLTACISGWAMLNGLQAVIPDIYLDRRIPHDAYRPTGIHSLVMTPIGEPEAFAALGAYWREVRQPSPEEITVLSALASCMATALDNMQLMDSLREEARRAEARRAELRFQADLLDAVGEAVIATDAAGAVTFWNRAAERLYGWTSQEVLGRPILELTPAPATGAQSQQILTSLQRGQNWSGEISLRRRDGTTFPALVTDSVIRDPQGRVTAMLGVSRDISERHRADAHRQLLINELNHRVKNTLAIVQSLAAQSLRRDRPVASVRADFESRLMALASAHNLVTDAAWGAVTVADLIARTIHPFVEGDEAARFLVDGPQVALDPKAAVAFALAMHELCTNAAKYGALSVPEGRVEVLWRLGGETAAPRMLLTWRESHGPTVTPPKARGFGSRLLERGLAEELHGKVRLQFLPQGLVCEMDLAAPQETSGEVAEAELFPLPS